MFLMFVGSAVIGLKTFTAALFVTTIGMLMTTSADADESFLGDPYPYIANNRPIQAAFADLTRLTGVPAVLGDDVRGSVSVSSADGDMRSFLNAVSAQNTLVWWRDGGTLRIESASAIESTLLPLKGVNPEHLEERLAELDLLQTKFALRATLDGTMIRASGPQGYLSAVEDVIESLATDPLQLQPQTTPRVFRGNRPVGE